MYYILDTNSDFLCLSFFTLWYPVGIIPIQHSIAHPLQGLGDFQGSYFCTQHTYTYRIPMSGHCATTKKLYMCDVMGH